MLKNKIYILLLIPIVVFSQINTMSPYSFYGVGDLSIKGFPQNIFMGGLSNSISDPYHLNFHNPSSYSFLDLTSAELAFGITFSGMQQNNLVNTDVNSNVIGFGIGFPISKNGGIGIGFRPYSSIGYDVEYSSEQALDQENVGELRYNFSGNGGLNQAIFGLSYELFDLIALGFNLNYYFGTISRVNSVEFDSTGFYNYRDISSLLVRDFQLEYGMLIHHKIKNHVLSFGLVLSPSSNIKSKQTRFAYTYTLSGDYEYFENMIYDSEQLNDPVEEGNIKFPMSLNTGFNISKSDNWLIGLDYNYSKWGEYRLFNSKDNYLENINEIIIGGYFIPKLEDIHNYWNKVQYRLGFSYSSGYLNLDAIQNFEGINSGLLKEYKISFGLGMPIPKNKSQFNFGAQFGIRGAQENLLIRENYIKLIFSMTFNDKWFKKRKIE